MGQRHQIYVVLPKDHPQAAAGKKVIGIHHQWLYGHTAARMCERFLRYVLEAKKSSCHPFVEGFQSAGEILSAIYSIDHDNGYYHNVTVLDYGEPEDPSRGDNNDGITVFDLRRLKGKRGRIGYCFVSLFDGYKDLPKLKPLSARQYVRGYYPAEVDDVREPGFKIVRLPNGEKNDPENRVRAIERLRVPLMTSQDLHEVWPGLFPAPEPSRVPLKLVLCELGDGP
jgi:hypothetical protein